MTNAELTVKLRELGLNRQQLSDMIGRKYSTVLRWSLADSQVPEFVENFLFYYEKSKKYDEIMEKLGVSK